MSRSRAAHFEVMPTGLGAVRSGGAGREELLELVSSVGLGGSATAGRFLFFHARGAPHGADVVEPRGPLER